LKRRVLEKGVLSLGRPFLSLLCSDSMTLCLNCFFLCLSIIFAQLSEIPPGDMIFCPCFSNCPQTAPRWNSI
jgi:hypothetical protein